MKVMIRRFLRLSALVRRLFYLRNKISFCTVGKLYLTKFDLGANCIFHAPVNISYGQGRLEIGESNGFGYYCAPKYGDGALLIQPRKPEAQIIIGNKNWFSNNVTIIANEKISIGNECRIGDNVSFFDCDFHEIDPAHRGRSHGPTSPVVISNNVWIGSGVKVLKGVTIGENSVIGAMSLVTRSIPANCIAAGNPARVVSQLPQAQRVAEL